MLRRVRLAAGETWDRWLYRLARRDYSRLLKVRGTEAVRAAMAKVGERARKEGADEAFAGVPSKSGGWNG